MTTSVNCPTCGKPVRASKYNLQCSVCGMAVHVQCISEEVTACFACVHKLGSARTGASFNQETLELIRQKKRSMGM